MSVSFSRLLAGGFWHPTPDHQSLVALQWRTNARDSGERPHYSLTTRFWSPLPAAKLTETERNYCLPFRSLVIRGRKCSRVTRRGRRVNSRHINILDNHRGRMANRLCQQWQLRDHRVTR